MERLDKLMADMGVVVSRTRSRRMIEEGNVTVDGIVVRDPSQRVSRDAVITLLQADMPWVSRAALKLEHALTHWKIDPHELRALDVGSSTGGFSEVLLSRGIKDVYAVDVGKFQFAEKLKHDTRVHLFESTDIRNFEFPEGVTPVDLAVVDVSFISLLLVLPRVHELLKKGGTLVALIKPQFEVGRGNTDKGIVRDEVRRQESKERVIEGVKALGFEVKDTILSPIEGGDGNVEYLLYAVK